MDHFLTYTTVLSSTVVPIQKMYKILKKKVHFLQNLPEKHTTVPYYGKHMCIMNLCRYKDYHQDTQKL